MIGSIEALYPDAMAGLSVPDFMGALHSLDDEYAKKVAMAKQEGKVLRYVASVTPPVGGEAATLKV